MIEKEGFNKSFIFLLPILTQYLPYSHKYFDCMIDSYVFDSEKSFENCLIIKYKFDTIRPEFKSYEHELTNNVLHVKTLDMNENVIYVFKFPEEHLDDYFLFLEGKYSQLSKLSKTAILKFWSTIPSSYKWKEPFVIKLNRIFNKDVKLRTYIEEQIGMKLPEDAELASTIYVEHETFNYD